MLNVSWMAGLLQADTLLEEITRRGHQTRDEIAFQIIQKDPGLFKNHPVEFSREVYQAQKCLEDSLKDKEGIVTLDRGLIACKGYYLAQGIAVPYELEQFLEMAYYDCVFLCEMLPEQYWTQTRSGHPRKGTYNQGILIHETIRFLYKRSGF